LLIHESSYSETIELIYKTIHFSFVGVEALSNFLEAVPYTNILKITFLHVAWEDLTYSNLMVTEDGHPTGGQYTIVGRIQAARRKNERSSRSKEALSKWERAWQQLAKITEIAPLKHIHITIFDRTLKYDFTYPTMLPCLKHVRADSFFVDAPERLENVDNADVALYNLHFHWQLGTVPGVPFGNYIVRKCHRKIA
jgi:hypothetical protein